MEETIMSGTDIGYWIAMFLLGGTNIWSIIMYVLERKKRKVELEGSEADVSQKEFDTVKDQFEVFDKRLENYSTSLIAAEATITELRNEIYELQKERMEMEITIVKLQQEQKQRDDEIKHLQLVVCYDTSCTKRIKD